MPVKRTGGGDCVGDYYNFQTFFSFIFKASLTIVATRGEINVF